LIAVIDVIVLVASGIWYFRKTEQTFCRRDMSDAEAPSTTPAMPDPAITIENLGKRYTIGHQRAQR